MAHIRLCTPTVAATASVGFVSDRWEIDGLFNYDYVSASPVYAGKRRVPYNGFGGGLRGVYSFTDSFSCFLEGSVMYNLYIVDEAFISGQAKIGPRFTLINNDAGFRLAIDAPIGVEVRKDVTAMTIGVRCSVNYDIHQDEE